jgi:hypothetical protein
VRTQRGQAGIEYIAIVLVVGVALLGAAVAADASGVPRAVRTQFAHALCIATLGDCDEEREPCTVASSTKTTSLGLSLAFFRIGHDRTVIRERRSDGTVSLTLVNANLGGLEVGGGDSLKLSLGTRTVMAGSQASASILGRIASGRTWELPNDRVADAVLAQLSHGDDEWALPVPATTFGEKGWTVSASGAIARQTLSASLGISAADVDGRSVDTKTGRQTFSVRRGSELTGSLALTKANAQGATARGESYAVTVDRAGRPIDLVVTRTGEVSASYQLPQELQGAPALLRLPSGIARAWSTDTHLDLTDPDNLAAAKAFLEQVRNPRPRLGRAVEVSSQLARRLAQFGVVNTREYATTTSRSGIEGSVGALDLRIGGHATTTDEKMRLVGAATRGLDGTWVTRDDCLQGARSE